MTPEQALASKGQVTLPQALPAAQLPAPATKPTASYPDGLTAREVEVLRLLAQGLTDTQIAEQLVISPRTVNNHLTSIYSKIQVLPGPPPLATPWSISSSSSPLPPVRFRHHIFLSTLVIAK